MTTPEPSISVRVDPANPGQFFACCGLLELAHRLRPGAEARFEGTMFHIWTPRAVEPLGLTALIQKLLDCQFTGELSPQETEELDSLNADKKRLEAQQQKLPEKAEERRKSLDKQRREGAITVGGPFSIRLDWWQVGEDDPATVKTWSGQQGNLDIALAAKLTLAQLPLAHDLGERLLPFSHVLKKAVGEEGDKHGARKKKRGKEEDAEPFYFDARRARSALDIGFSPDVQKMPVEAHPAVELLCLIGLQRFRPAPTKKRRVFDYWTWTEPLPAAVASAAVAGALPARGDTRWRFRLLCRDNQCRYKAFDFATPFRS